VQTRMKSLSLLISFAIATTCYGAEFFKCGDIYTDSPINNSCSSISITEQKIERPKSLELKDSYNNYTTTYTTTYPPGYERKKEYHTATLKRVIDGDTIEVEMEGKPVRVRYKGIDCPEISQKGGQEAKEANKNMLSSTVTLITDDQTDGGYGRLAAYIQYGNSTVNEELVKKGYCWAYGSEFKDIQEKAKAYREGIWKDDNPQSPSEYRQTAPKRIRKLKKLRMH
jgi:micrococcal nuclease